jgi:hypothetical protein
MTAVLCAFDLIEINGKELRSAPIEERKHVLADVLDGERDGIAFNVHYDRDGIRATGFNFSFQEKQSQLSGERRHPISQRMRSASVVLSIVACSFGGRRSQASSRATFIRAIVWASKWAAAFAIQSPLARLLPGENGSW